MILRIRIGGVVAMAVKERSAPMADVSCACGAHATFRVGAVWHAINGKKIALHHVPHYVCEMCSTVIYDSHTPVFDVLKRAYLEGLDEVEWPLYTLGAPQGDSSS